jgi:predicted AAA+ superfamily ATPase
MRSVAESLAGRMAIVELSLLLRPELRAAAMRDRLWLVGGFPDGGVRKPRTFRQWQLNYARLIAERDLSKRLVKAPKLVMRDSGLLHALLGISSVDALLAHPAVGASWETHVIEQCIGVLAARGIPHEAHHFRTSDGYDIDLLLDIGRERWAIEVKLTSDPSPHDLERLGRCAQMVGATRSFLVSRVRRDAGRGARVSCGLDRMLRELVAVA